MVNHVDGVTIGIVFSLQNILFSFSQEQFYMLIRLVCLVNILLQDLKKLTKVPLADRIRNTVRRKRFFFFGEIIEEIIELM